MHRYRRPAVVVSAVALLASIAVHLPVYSALGALARAILPDRETQAAAPEPVRFEILDDPSPDAPEPEPEATAAPEPDPPTRPKPLPSKPRPEVKPPPAPKQPPPTPEKPKATKPPPDIASTQAIRQRSRDPSVKPPVDSRYIADENQRVEEETAARVRNYRKDDPEPSLAAAEPSATPEKTPGDSARTKVADLRNRAGPEDRAPADRAGSARQASAAPSPPGASAGHASGEPASGRPRGAAGPTPSASSTPASPTPSDAAPSKPSPAAERAPDRVAIHDGMGTISVPRGGARAGAARTPAGKAAGKASGAAGQGGRGGVNLRLSWRQFEKAIGSDQLADERRQYRERRSRRAGFNHRRMWKQFRAAIENFTPNVRPGNQTALNAAANPFANYLTAVHLRIHREYADRFLRSIPSVGTDPFADRSLMTRLEIIINGDGGIHRVGVVKSSGFLLFDHGAFTSVMRAGPFPPPPEAIKSGDGRVYFHWGFYRNERQCGTFNAEPYMLPNPPNSPRDTTPPGSGSGSGNHGGGKPELGKLGRAPSQAGKRSQAGAPSGPHTAPHALARPGHGGHRKSGHRRSDG